MSSDDRPRVLVVDDSPANLMAVEAVLQPLDVAMPEMDGFETAARIRERDRNRELPILFLTAHRIPANVVKGLALGAVEYLEKPVEPDVLRAKVASYCGVRLGILGYRGDIPISQA